MVFERSPPALCTELFPFIYRSIILTFLDIPGVFQGSVYVNIYAKMFLLGDQNVSSFADYDITYINTVKLTLRLARRL